MKFFSLDSPLIQVLNRVADLMWLNILVVICSLPIFTVGASMTALYYMLIKIVRGEDIYLTKGFMKAFKQNFKQATPIWLMELLILGIVAGDFYIMLRAETKFHIVFQVLILVATLLILFTCTFVYPVLSKFDNTIFNTLKNALSISILQFPKTILMMIMSVIPVLLLLLVPTSAPLVLMFGISLPAYLFTILFNKFFLKIENQILEANGPKEVETIPEEDDDRIFKDELDESLFGPDVK